MLKGVPPNTRSLFGNDSFFQWFEKRQTRQYRLSLSINRYIKQVLKCVHGDLRHGGMIFRQARWP
jgi:hypothetical protein